MLLNLVLEKTLESPLDCKEVQPVHPKGDQSWVFIGRTMLKLKVQYFGHLMWRADSFEKTLMLWKIEGRRKRGWQRMRWLDSITDLWTWVLVNSSSWWWTGMPGVLWSMGSQRVGHDWVTELKWTEPQDIVERFASQRTPLPLFEWKKSIISSSLPMQRAQLQRKQEVFHKVLLPFLLFLYHKLI